MEVKPGLPKDLCIYRTKSVTSKVFEEACDSIPTSASIDEPAIEIAICHQQKGCKSHGNLFKALYKHDIFLHRNAAMLGIDLSNNSKDALFFRKRRITYAQNIIASGSHNSSFEVTRLYSRLYGFMVVKKAFENIPTEHA